MGHKGPIGTHRAPQGPRTLFTAWGPFLGPRGPFWDPFLGQGPLFGPGAQIIFWILGCWAPMVPLLSPRPKFGARFLGPRLVPGPRAEIWAHFWARGPQTKKMRAEKPCRILGSEFQMVAYAPSYGQKPFWGRGLGSQLNPNGPVPNKGPGP